MIFESDEIKLEVNMQDETVWLTQKQMAELFKSTRNNITMHINNCYIEGELSEIATSKDFLLVQNEGNRKINRKIKYYSLDVIISVGYRVKSKRGTEFRIWANKILKDYLLKGYAINNQRLEYLEKTVQLIDIANRIDYDVDNKEIRSVLNVIGNYSKALDLLDDYDHKTMSKPKGSISNKTIEYEECLEIIKELKFNETSKLFALERDEGLKSIIRNIYLTYNDKDVYESLEEKAANFLYLVIKNHVFIDGNKRIAATLFIYFLEFNQILYKNSNPIIDNNTLAALTLLIAQSNPKEKEILIDLVINFLT